MYVFWPQTKVTLISPTRPTSKERLPFFLTKNHSAVQQNYVHVANTPILNACILYTVKNIVLVTHGKKSLEVWNVCYWWLMLASKKRPSTCTMYIMIHAKTFSAELLIRLLFSSNQPAQNWFFLHQRFDQIAPVFTGANIVQGNFSHISLALNI